MPLFQSFVSVSIGDVGPRYKRYTNISKKRNRTTRKIEVEPKERKQRIIEREPELKRKEIRNLNIHLSTINSK